MSPRAACRLETAGFTPVYDYVAGKADWLAADLPYVGTARLIGSLTRRQVATVDAGTSAADTLARLAEVGFGPAAVLHPSGVLLGTVDHDELEAAPADTPVDRLLRFGVTTVRPSEEITRLTARMRQHGISQAAVTRSDGTFLGLFFPEDAPQDEHVS